MAKQLSSDFARTSFEQLMQVSFKVNFGISYSITNESLEPPLSIFVDLLTEEQMQILSTKQLKYLLEERRISGINTSLRLETYRSTRWPLTKMFSKILKHVPQDAADAAAETIIDAWQVERGFEGGPTFIDSERRAVLATVALGIAPKLSPSRALPLLDRALAAIGATVSTTVLRRLGPAAAALAHNLKGTERRNETAIVAKMINELTDLDQQEALAQIACILGTEVELDRATELFGVLLTSLLKRGGWQPSERVKALVALSASLSSSAAESAIIRLEYFLKSPNSPEQMRRAALEVAQALVSRLSGPQAQMALERMLDSQWKMRVSEARDDLGQISAKLVIQIDPKLQGEALSLAEWELSFCGSDEEAIAWATTIGTLLPKDPKDVYFKWIVEVLKYPTVGGRAAGVLMDALHEADVGVPGAAAGLQANLTWIADHFRSVDVVAPPVQPKQPARPPRLWEEQ